MRESPVLRRKPRRLAVHEGWRRVRRKELGTMKVRWYLGPQFPLVLLRKVVPWKEWAEACLICEAGGFRIRPCVLSPTG